MIPSHEMEGGWKTDFCNTKMADLGYAKQVKKEPLLGPKQMFAEVKPAMA